MISAFLSEPTTPILKAQTCDSSKISRADFSTKSDDKIWKSAKLEVFWMVKPVAIESGWQPSAKSVSASAVSPAPPVESSAEKVITRGGVLFIFQKKLRFTVDYLKLNLNSLKPVPESSNGFKAISVWAASCALRWPLPCISLSSLL